MARECDGSHSWTAEAKVAPAILRRPRPKGEFSGQGKYCLLRPERRHDCGLTASRTETSIRARKRGSWFSSMNWSVAIFAPWNAP